MGETVSEGREIKEPYDIKVPPHSKSSVALAATFSNFRGTLHRALAVEEDGR